MRVRASEYRNAVSFEHRWATQLTDLLQALNEVRPHVVHFSGHGSQTALAFEDDDGKTKTLSAALLGQLLNASSDRIRLALFNSCESAAHAEAACDSVDAAIGMNAPIDDEAARVFAGQFYNALGFGKSLQDAFKQAQLQVQLALGSSGGDAELFTAAGIEAEKLYLVRPPNRPAD